VARRPVPSGGAEGGEFLPGEPGASAVLAADVVAEVALCVRVLGQGVATVVARPLGHPIEDPFHVGSGIGCEPAPDRAFADPELLGRFAHPFALLTMRHKTNVPILSVNRDRRVYEATRNQPKPPPRGRSGRQ
jgi:hypothetical protein